MPDVGSPQALAQSALGFGAFSYVMDRVGHMPASASTVVTCSEGSCKRQQWQVASTLLQQHAAAFPML